MPRRATPTLLEGRSAAQSMDAVNPARCVRCDCTDRQACPGGCSWLAVNRANRTGVCSRCPGALKQWRNQQVTE